MSEDKLVATGIRERLASIAHRRLGVWCAGLRTRALVLVLLAYCCVTLVCTYPVALHPLTKPAGSTDVYEYMWELWWAKRSLIDMHTSPANVTSLYHPYGSYHPLLLLDAYLMWTSLPAVMLFGPTFAANLHVLSSYVLTGFTTYLLCYWLTRRHWASFVGGLVFAFSPFRADRAAHGDIAIALTYWLPLYVLFLLWLMKRPGVRKALLCGVCLGFSILSSFLHLAHFLMPVTVVLLVHQHFADRRSLYSARFLGPLALAVVVAGVMIGPFYLPLLQAKLGGELEYFPRFGILGHSAALLSFVVPPSFHSLLRGVGPLRASVENLLPGRYYVVYLGIVSLALAACGLVRKRTGVWLAVALVSVVLALGPLLHVTGDLVQYSVGDRAGFVLLPAALLRQLPFYEWARSPARFGELTMFSIAVLAGYGATVLSNVSAGRALRVVGAAAFPVLILLDYALFVPFPVLEVRVPEFFRALPPATGSTGILDVGSERLNHQGMYYQTVHQYPIVRGFIYRYPSGADYYQKFIEQLIGPENDIVNVGDFVPILRQLRVQYVVLHTLAAEDGASLGRFLAASLGPAVYEDDQIAVFTVPAGATQDSEIPLVVLGQQWHPVESIDGVPSRWMVNDGTLFARVDTNGAYRLSFVAHPYRQPRHLEVFVGGKLVGEYEVGGMQQYVTSPFLLKGGEWTAISLHVPEGCEVPSEVTPGQADERCLSMLFQQLQVTSERSD